MPPHDSNPFPDMSLPPRADALPSWKEIAPSSPTPSAPPNADALPPRIYSFRKEWRVGDIVLAPWEPIFLYVGRIAAIEQGRARIAFGDGDEGWVLLEQIRAVAFQPGQRLLSRRHMSPHFFEATVCETRDAEVLLEFVEGGTREWAPHKALRIPCQPSGPPAQMLRLDSPRHEPLPQHYHMGQRVWAPWFANNLFVGTIQDIRPPEALIHFDDGDRGWVQLAQLFPFELIEGTLVLAKRGATYDPAVITNVNIADQRAFLKFEDGKTGWYSSSAFALPCEPRGPNARATAGNHLRTWLPTLAIIVAIALLRGCLR